MLETSSSEEDCKECGTVHHVGHHPSTHPHHQEMSDNLLSPSPLVDSEKIEVDLQEKQEREEEEERKRRIQLYVFVSRCIACPLDAKQPTDMMQRQMKITQQQLETIINRFQCFVKEEMQVMADEAFQNVLQSYYDVFLQSEGLATLVQSGACSLCDFREVFKIHIEKFVGSLPVMEGCKKAVFRSWMAKCDCILKVIDNNKQKPSRIQHKLNVSKAQLYDMFQQILGVKKFEHQLLFKALRLDSAGEQVAAIRRELDSRMQIVADMEKNHKSMPKSLLKEKESLHVEELKMSMNLLTDNLDILLASRRSKASKYGLRKLNCYNYRSHGSLETLVEESSNSKSKLNAVLTFQLKVIVMEVKGLTSLSPDRIVYCTMEVGNRKKLQTDQTEVSKPMWYTQGDFRTTRPLPVVKIKLYTKNTQMLSLEDTELGKVILKPTPLQSKASEWHKMTISKNLPNQDLKIKIAYTMDKPSNIKYCGYLYAIGNSVWKKWKKRYYVLVEVSEYSFAMCRYKEKKSKPSEIIQLDGYTVDYIEASSANLMVGRDLEGGKFFFSAIKERDTIIFASDDEDECHLWAMAMYQVTGQSQKLSPPLTVQDKNSTTSKIQGDADKGSKHEMKDIISADPCQFDHHFLFKLLQNFILEFRLNESDCSLGWFSPEQVFVLDEYCARYGVRGCYRHLCYLSDLLDRAEKNIMIDPTLMYCCFAYCARHIHVDRPAGVESVTHEEKEQFQGMKERLRALLENQIINFRNCFPFGRPEGALQATLSLLEKVLMKDLVTPVPKQEVRDMIKKCLETAASVNYNKISSEAKIRKGTKMVSPSKKLDALKHLAKLCVNLSQQNNEHYAEAFALFDDLFVEHAEIFWSLFAVDMDKVLAEPADDWSYFPLFQILNDYLRNDDHLKNGRFHQHLRDTFAPLVLQYVDLMESNITESIHKSFEKEKWAIKGLGCATSEDLFCKLDKLQSFIRDLHWPDVKFRQNLEECLRIAAFDMTKFCIQRTETAFQQRMKESVVSTDYFIPSEICAMINVILDAKNQSLKWGVVDGIGLDQHHTKINDMIEKINANMVQELISKLLTILEATLSKLSRYDKGRLIGSILSFSKNSSKAMGQGYVNFTRNCMQQIRQKVTDLLWILTFFEQWYNSQTNMICNWLLERPNQNLRSYQRRCLAYIVKKMYSDFEHQGIMEDTLNSTDYQTITRRMQTEEIICALTIVEEAGRKLKRLRDGDNRRKPMETIVESLSGEEGTFVSNIGTMVCGRMGNIFGNGVGGMGSNSEGGTSSWL